MSTSVYHRHCSIGNHPIPPNESRRVIGLDQSGWPDTPPICLYACHTCLAIAQYRACAVIHPGQTIADHLPQLPQPGDQLTLSFQVA